MSPCGKKRSIRQAAAVFLSAVLLSGAALQPAHAASGAVLPAIPEKTGDAAAFCKSLWAGVQKYGEDVITFPSRIFDAVEAGRSAYYGFYLEKETDLSICLEADSPCVLALARKEVPVSVRTLPFVTQKIEESSVPPGYYQVYVVPRGGSSGGRTEFTLTLGSSADYGEEPDLSEFDLSGKLHNVMSPFRVFDGSDHPVYDKKGAVINSKDYTGDSFKAASYFLNWMGPAEEDDELNSEDGILLATPSDYMQYRPEIPSFHVQEMICLPGAESSEEAGSGEYIRHWKNALMTCGAIETGMCVNRAFWASEESGSDSMYYYVPVDFNDRYGLSAGLRANHNVAVIGWDDTIPKEQFRVHFVYRTVDGIRREADYTPPGDGGWIVRNSWGELTHGEGDFFISYYDAYVGTDTDRAVFARLESVRNYNHIYENDLGVSEALGSSYAARLYKGKKKGMASQTFVNETGAEELLRAVSFGTPYSGFRYKIYASTGGGRPQLLKQGYENYAGIHTVRLDQGVPLSPGTEFTVYAALELPEKAWAAEGMFYSTSFGKDMSGNVGKPARYYTKGDDDFSAAVTPQKDGDFPLIHALCYADLGDSEEDPESLVTIPDFYNGDGTTSTKTMEIRQKKGTAYEYEDGVTPSKDSRGFTILYLKGASSEEIPVQINSATPSEALKENRAAGPATASDAVIRKATASDAATATASDALQEGVLMEDGMIL
ncbi:MAG: hypothetical protein IKH70_05455, partial [Stomatobaculum sp.]|nr:hypothetical protein [Stomatobaculum sp.]